MKKLLLLAVTTLMLLFLVACPNKPTIEDPTIEDPTIEDPTIEDPTIENPTIDKPTIDNPTIEREMYPFKTYSETDEYGNAGTYTEINSRYAAGDAIELEASVKPGYNFAGWFINNICVSEDLEYTYTMKSQSVRIEARYTYFTIRTSSNSNEYEMAGTYTEYNNKKISVGEQVTLEATVNEGYNFEGWYIGDVCVSEGLSYSFIMKAKNVNLEARFSSYTFTSFSDSDREGYYGTYTKIDEQKVRAGDAVTLTAVAAEGCNFEGWYIWNDWYESFCVSEDLEFNYVMKKEDVRIEARFSGYTLNTGAFLMTYGYDLDNIKPGVNAQFFWTYDWTDYDSSMGNYSRYENVYVSAGEMITLTATVKSGYTFLGWKRGYDLITRDYTYTFEMGKSDVIYEAVYIKNK